MKKIFILICLLLATVNLMAEPIGEHRAREIASMFFSQHTTRVASDITLEWAGDNISESSAIGSALNTSLMYIYNRGTNDGFVVVAGDSNATPIIAYSFNSTLNINNMPEATAAILDAWCRQVEGARKVAKPISNTTMHTTTRSNDALLCETALWSQNEPYNLETPVIYGYRTMTGCVATAMAMICHYHRWPENGVGTTPQYSYTDIYGIRRTVNDNPLGRKYDYDNMLSNYNDGYTDEQANAVAALMKDLGTSVEMMYHYVSSSTFDKHVLKALATYFGYSKSIKYVTAESYTATEWNNIIRENIREYGPTYFSGASQNGGHAFVVDGFDTDDYFHFNFGWSGYGNGYYLLPSITYYLRQAAILYLEPDKSGTSTYIDDIRLVTHGANSYYYSGIYSYASAYATGNTFKCLMGGFNNAGIAIFDGEVKLILCDKYGNWKEELYTTNITNLLPGSLTYIPAPTSVSITQTIEHGDRLRLYYKGQYSSDWQWARSKNRSTVYDELLVIATPKELANGISFEYDKASNTITFITKHATTANVYDAEIGNLITSFNLAAGDSTEMTITKSLMWEFSLGSDPYYITIRK